MNSKSNFELLDVIYSFDGRIVGSWGGHSIHNLKTAMEIAINIHDCVICADDLPHQEQIPEDLKHMMHRFRGNEGCCVWGCDTRGNCLISWELTGGRSGEEIMTVDQAREFMRSLALVCGIRL